MKRFSEAQLQEIRDRHPVKDVAAGYVTLRRSGTKLIGPCPICSDNPQSKTAKRFEIADGRWCCAVCEDGGDVLQLVMRAEGLNLRGAVEHLGGARHVDPEEAARREVERDREREAREREADQSRERERAKAFGCCVRGAARAGPRSRRLGVLDQRRPWQSWRACGRHHRASCGAHGDWPRAARRGALA